MKRTIKGASLVALVAAAALPGWGCTGTDTVEVTPSGPAPEAMKAPPPISGGTLAITRDHAFAIAADSGADSVAIVDLDSDTVAREIALEPGDEPGRVTEGLDGQVHVALRRGGAIATIDLASGEVTRRNVCAAPRGMAYDQARGELHVACAGGELVTFGNDLDAAPLRSMLLQRDLRDVVIRGDRLLVSRFRSAEVLVVNGSGTVQRTLQPSEYTSPINLRPFTPAVAWRMLALPGGGVAVVHQRGFSDEIPTGAPPVAGQSYYGGFCDQVIVHAAVTLFDPDLDTPVTLPNGGGIGNLVLPVDMAVDPSTSRLAVVAAGSEQVFETSLDTVRKEDVLQNCSPFEDQTQMTVNGEPLAVAYDGQGRLLVQTRQPAALHVLSGGQETAKIDFSSPSRRDHGHALFHRAAADLSPIACASCHPEGGDDGRVWLFDVGPRRTQNVTGGVLSTMPLHWDGDLDNLHEFVGEVFVTRMGGAEQSSDVIDELGSWLNELPTVPSSSWLGGDAVARGEALFNDATVGCNNCHAGGRTNNETVDVGTGKAFQVPSLAGVANRPPFMHDGCAQTLRDRFDPACGGGDAHGKTSQLSEAQLGDLIAYLETL